MSSFLDLPAELRCQVYGYIVIPHTAPLSSYIGLYLSCHQVKFEMDVECAKVSRNYLKAIEDQFPDVRIDMPQSFPEMQHIRMTIPESSANICRRPGFCHLLEIFSLHIATLSIKYDFSKPLPLSNTLFGDLTGLKFVFFIHLDMTVAMRPQVRMDYSYSATEDAQTFVYRFSFLEGSASD